MTDDEVPVLIAQSKPWVFNRKPPIEVYLTYVSRYAVETGRINPYDTESRTRRFRFFLSTDTLDLGKIQEDRFGMSHWETLRDSAGRASAVFLLSDLLTERTWHRPTRIQFNYQDSSE